MLYETSQPVTVTDWTGERHALIDGVRMIEANTDEGESK
jgi:hypothetical protein